MTDKDDASNEPEAKSHDDEALEKLAVEELLQEAVQGAARAAKVGPSGWVKAPKLRTNKRFLANTLRHVLNSNKYHSLKTAARNSTKTSPKFEFKPESTIRKDSSKRKY